MKINDDQTYFLYLMTKLLNKAEKDGNAETKLMGKNGSIFIVNIEKQEKND